MPSPPQAWPYHSWPNTQDPAGVTTETTMVTAQTAANQQLLTARAGRPLRVPHRCRARGRMRRAV